jgi:hypothetical protein
MYTDSKDAIAIVQRAFPEYRHSPNNLRVDPFKGSIRPTSYWSGGSRDYWAFVPLVDGVTVTAQIPENGSGFTASVAPINQLPVGCALVCFTKGYRQHAMVILNAEDLAPVFSAPSEDLTRDQTLVLMAHCLYKAAFRREYCRKTGISESRFSEIVAELKQKRLIMTNGAPSEKGRNCVDGKQWFDVADKPNWMVAA